MAFAASPSDANKGTQKSEARDSSKTDAESEVPLLPPPDPNAANKDKIPSIKLGETIRFEEWGPIILNSDGTTRRIANWDQLTEQEKEATWRRISKRNEQRRQALLKQMEEGIDGNNGKEEL